MTIQRVRIKNTSNSPRVSALKEMSDQNDIPIAAAPSNFELHQVVSAASDGSALTNYEMWIWRWGIFGCLCLIGCTLIVLVYRLNLSRWETVSSAPATIQVDATRYPTPSSVNFDRTSIEVRVVNASGIAGRAKTVRDALVKRGYRDGGIESADELGESSVTVTSDIQSFLTDIQRDIFLDSGISAAAEIYTGKNHAITIILGAR